MDEVEKDEREGETIARFTSFLLHSQMGRPTVYLSRPRIWFPHLSTKTRSGTSVLRKLAICLAANKKKDRLNWGENVLGLRAGGVTLKRTII